MVIFNLGYLFHEILAAGILSAGMGPGVQRAEYKVPVVFLAFALYVTLMAWVFPIFHQYFAQRRGWSPLRTGALVGLFFGFLWDALQGGIIEYATYNVELGAMLIDSSYHLAEGVLAGTLIGLFQRPRSDRPATA